MSPFISLEVSEDENLRGLESQGAMIQSEEINSKPLLRRPRNDGSTPKQNRERSGNL
jgi:hypothetical protein